MSGDESKTNVLIVHNYYQIPGGEDTVVANEKRMLEKYGHKVNLYTRDNSEIKGFSRLQKLMLPLTSIFNWKTYKDVKRIIRERHIDVVHVHNTLHLISPSVYYAAVRCKTPVVQTVHNFRLLCPGATFYRDGHICEECVEKGFWRAVRHGCYRESRMQTLLCVLNIKCHTLSGIYKRLNYICLTDFNKKKLLYFKQINPEKVFIKPNFVISTNKTIPVGKRKNRFIFVGRLESIKGIDVLLKAWKLMGDKAPELYICGTGIMEQWCKEYIKTNRLISVKMKGYVPNGQARELIANSKGFILPTQWYEGFPMAMVEAFSTGTPVIVSDIGNAGDLVKEGLNGYKFTASSAQGLIRALCDMEYCSDIYQTTEREYRGKYTEKQNYKYLMDIYKNVQGLV